MVDCLGIQGTVDLKIAVSAWLALLVLFICILLVCMYVSFGQGSSLLWTHTLRPFYSRPIALTQEGRSLVNDL